MLIMIKWVWGWKSLSLFNFLFYDSLMVVLLMRVAIFFLTSKTLFIWLVENEDNFKMSRDKIDDLKTSARIIWIEHFIRCSLFKINPWRNQFCLRTNCILSFVYSIEKLGKAISPFFIFDRKSLIASVVTCTIWTSLIWRGIVVK